MAMAILGILAQFLWLGARGRRGGPSQHVGGAGGGTGWRCYALGSDYCEFSRKRGRGRRGRKEERLGREKGAGSWRLGAAPEGPHRPGQAGGGEVDVQEASTHLFPVTQQRRQSAFANSPLVLGSFPEKFKTALVLYHLML
jgi:hypothetical protein